MYETKIKLTIKCLFFTKISILSLKKDTHIGIRSEDNKVVAFITYNRKHMRQVHALIHVPQYTKTKCSKIS